MRRIAFLTFGLCTLALSLTLPVGAGVQHARPYVANRDCSFVNGVCTNPTSGCTTSGGSCAVPLVGGGNDGGEGDDGGSDDTTFAWEDPNGDGCGCQI